MNKRVEQKKKRSAVLRDKLRKTLAILFCISLLILSVNITDMSTRKMIMCNDDKYAMAVSLQENNLLRLDIAGEKFMVNIEPVVRISNNILDSSKRRYDSIMKNIRAKLEK